MAGHDPRGDLAPRDVVAARMAAVIAAGDAGHVWLDATRLGRDLLENGFPTVTAACRKHGIDPVHAMIPVAPGAHYSCGGIRADLDGRTTIPGLYAVGEAASTGIQGANRLASNSVTEAIIAGRRTGTAIADIPALGHPRLEYSGPVAHMGASYGLGAPAASSWTTAEDGVGSRNPGLADRSELAQAMSRYAGVMRDADGLTELLRVTAGSRQPRDGAQARNEGWAGDGGQGTGGWDVEHAAVLDAVDLELEAVEAANLRTVSLLIAAGALRRAESRGCHRRRDAAGTAAAPWHTLARWDGEELVVTEETL
jgi:L-aspartate oxidase